GPGGAGQNTTGGSGHVGISGLGAPIPHRREGKMGRPPRRKRGVGQPLALSEPLLRSAGLPDLKRVGRLDATTAVAAQLEISWWCPSAAEGRREQSRPWQRVAAQSSPSHTPAHTPPHTPAQALRGLPPPRTRRYE